MTLKAKIGVFLEKKLRFSANNGGIHALDVVRNTEIHALNMALGVIRRRS